MHHQWQVCWGMPAIFYTSFHFDAKDDAYSNANFEFWIERSGQMW